jgi:hypothetical protein
MSFKIGFPAPKYPNGESACGVTNAYYTIELNRFDPGRISRVAN